MSSCWRIRGAVDSIALFQCHVPTILEIFFFNTNFEQAIKISLRDFSLIPRLQEEEKTYACDRLQKEKLSIENVRLFLYFPVINYRQIYKAIDL